MGISGLLPALKSIQVTKHLKDYAGQSLAVDAYVWLHRGVYTCATDLATGNKTHKYVDYAMHRVRLLRHYGIKPYIVFDGGPLPAKKGTEHERKQKREENLSRGNTLTAQGKHSQAREFYLKCVDVTPQMAFQFIKALRAESVDYVVAPYEADAQLAYLERTGLVDAILTEDSDLLVFGCQNVLFKLDVVASTVISISRKDFGSLTSSDTNGISLFGWSDVQFRAMAILSGCDYLPSIPGIGLKTACTLLKKWKSAEQVIRAIMLEGKKSVPTGYWKQFQLAEKCFLHQRVYCPIQGKLVYLTEVTGEWNDYDEAYVGSDMDPILAKQIALGDANPVTRLPMDDINPGFVPRVLKPLPLVANNASQSVKNKIKGKGRESLPSGGILSFFGPNAIIPPRTKQDTPPTITRLSLSGKASGKRRLADVMDHDIAQKKKLRKSASPPRSNQSKFFHTPSQPRACSVQRRHSDGVIAMAGSSKLKDKENLYIVVDDDDEAAQTSEPDLDGSDLSLKAQYDRDTDMDLHVDEFPDVVEQEDGYISPTPSCSKDLQDLSSPLRPGQTPARRKWKSDQCQQVEDPVMVQNDEDAYFGVEAVSSPVSAIKRRVSPFVGRGFIQETPTKRNVNNDEGDDDDCILVHATPSPTKVQYPAEEIPSPMLYNGPDLRNALAIATDGATDLDYDEPPSPSPDTSDSAVLRAGQQITRHIKAVIDVDASDYDLDEDVEQVRLNASRTKVVMNGWRDRWALTSKTKKARQVLPEEGKTKSTPSGGLPRTAMNHCAPGSGSTRIANLRRSNTNVTPEGRHTLSSAGKCPRSAPSKMAVAAAGGGGGMKPMNVKGLGKARRSMLFVNEPTTNSSAHGGDRRCREIVDTSITDAVDDSTDVNGGRMALDNIALRAHERLSMFRCQ